MVYVTLTCFPAILTLTNSRLKTRLTFAFDSDASLLKRPTVVADPNKDFCSRGTFAVAAPCRAAPIHARNAHTDNPKFELVLPSVVMAIPKENIRQGICK